MVIIIEILIHKGREKIEIEYPQYNKGHLEMAITDFFRYKNIKWTEHDNRIIGIDGIRWLMGEWVFDLTIVELNGGSKLVGVFYLRYFWPFPEMKFCRYGFASWIPRRIGWNIKNELFYYIDQHSELNELSNQFKIDPGDRWKKEFSGEYRQDISTPGKEMDGFRGVKVVGVSNSDKKVVLSKYMEVFDLDSTRAENLYNAGYKSAEDFNDVLPEDLVMIERINPTIAKRIVRNIERLNIE